MKKLDSIAWLNDLLQNVQVFKMYETATAGRREPVPEGEKIID
jgi:hypothetical protein